jgi:hypothetical protein
MEPILVKPESLMDRANAEEGNKPRSNPNDRIQDKIRIGSFMFEFSFTIIREQYAPCI